MMRKIMSINSNVPDIIQLIHGNGWKEIPNGIVNIK